MSTQWQTLKPSDILTSEQSHRLRQRSDLMGLWLLAHCWGVIIAAWALYALIPHPATWLLGWLLVGGRQLGLAILMHEGSHGMLFRTRRFNETLAVWAAGAPVLVDMGAYRKRHMAHHRFTRTDDDPENYLYTPFPVSRTSMGRKFLRDITGIAFWRGQIGLFRFVKAKAGWAGVWHYYSRPLAFHAVLFACLAGLGRIDIFLLLWLLPLMTSYPLALRVRNIAEHATVPDLADPLRNSRTTLANPIERAFFAPYWVNYHIEHHLMPYVPCYRLPELHNILKAQGITGRMEIRKGYMDILRLNAGLKTEKAA